MSIQDYLTEAKTARPKENFSVPRDQPRKSALPRVLSRIRPNIPLLLCLAATLLVRAWLIFHTQGFVNGDEALVGIQAEHILHGEFPIYFYSQPYMGSLEAYLVALIFAIVGPSGWALRTEPTLLSLVAVWLTWKLAAELAEAAQLPRQAKRWFMTLSALFAAIPPLYDTVLELTTLGGYIESYLLMLLLLLSALKLTRRRRAGASAREITWRWAGIGFIVGLGFWINPIIIYGIAAAALWIGWDYLQLVREKRATKRLSRLVVSPLIAALPACIVGLTPAIIWGIRNSWQNLTYLLYLSGNIELRPEILAHYPTRVDIFFGLVNLYTTCDAPRVIGGALPGESSLSTFLHAPTLYPGLFCILACVSLFAASLVHPSPLLQRMRYLTGLPLLFAACVTIIFCVTKAAATGLWFCQYDFAGRYATPLMLVLPFLFATPFAALFCGRSILLGEVSTKVSKGTMKSAAHDGATQLNGPVASFHLESSTNLAPRLIPLVQATLGLLVGILLFALCLQVSSYGLTNAGSTFQSPNCTFAPINNNAIITYMEQEHIQYAWAPNWIAYPIVFDTQGRIIVADPLPFITNAPILNRIPANSNAVLHADRPSLIAFVKHTDQHPEILSQLNKEHVTYRFARFPAQEGRDVIVVTPLNRTVSPLQLNPYFSIFVCSRDS